VEKSGSKNEKELVERPYSVVINGDYILKAVLNPKNMKIAIKHVEGPLTFFESAAYGSLHEIEHLSYGNIKGIPFWDFEYVLE
jgi:predicted metalloprotease